MVMNNAQARSNIMTDALVTVLAMANTIVYWYDYYYFGQRLNYSYVNTISKVNAIVIVIVIVNTIIIVSVIVTITVLVNAKVKHGRRPVV